MGLAEGMRHYVKGIFFVFILIALVAAILPMTFTSIDSAPEGTIMLAEVAKFFLGLIVIAFVIFQALLPGLENFKNSPPPQQNFGDTSYNPYQGQGGFQ